MSLETKTTNQDPLLYDTILSKLDGRACPLSSNPHLEMDFLTHQQLRRESDMPPEELEKFSSIGELPDHMQSQIAQISEKLTYITGIDEELLQARIDRIVFTYVDEVVVEGKEVGGYFRLDDGTARAIHGERADLSNHYGLHEIVHGLFQNGTIYEKSDGQITTTGNGLSDFIFNDSYIMSTEEDKELQKTLVDINEGLIDMLTLDVSDIDDEYYLHNPSCGYTVNILVIRELLNKHPDIAQSMITAAIVTGIESRAQAQLFADTYKSIKSGLEL